MFTSLPSATFVQMLHRIVCLNYYFYSGSLYSLVNSNTLKYTLLLS